MYEGLIKALKNCNYPNCGYYCSQGCVMSHDGSTCELIPLLRKAADVIEELQKPKWIQFTSRELTEEKKAEHPDLKFYYVRSIGEYWIGRRIDNFYYAEYDPKSRQWVWTHSRYLPWGKHVVSPTSLWKEHTYPSEPEEIPFEEWLQGFIKKYAAEAIEVLSKKLASGFGEWISVKELLPKKTGWYFVACNELCYPNESFALYYVGNERFCEHNTGKDITKYVTHWMPLPEPPKEAE